MALRTTTANGSWTTGSTWVGGVAPGAGDRAEVQHLVTADLPFTVGASAGSNLTGTGTIGNAGGYGPTLTGVGTTFTTQVHPGDVISVGGSILGVVVSIASDTALTLAEYLTLADGSAFTYTPAAIYLSGPNAQLTVNAPPVIRGAFVQNTPYAVATDAVTVAAGVSIEFDASTAPDPANTHYPWLLLAANYQLGRVVFNGTSGARCTLRSNAGGGHAHVTTGPFLSMGSLTLTYLDLTRIGDATRDAIAFTQYFYAVVHLVLSGCTFDSGGRVALGQPPIAGSTLQVLDCTWTNTLHATDCLTQNGGTGATDGTSDIRGCVFDKGLNGFATGLTIGGPGAGDWNFFRAGYSIPTSTAWTIFRDNLVVSDQGEGLGTAGDVLDCYIHAAGSIPGNPHFLFGRTGAASTFRGVVLEYGGSDPSGDCTLNSGTKLTLRNCIKLPNAAGLSSGTLVTGINPGVDSVDVEHCTIHGGGSWDSSGVRLDTHAPAGMLSSLRANLYWDTTPRGFKLCYSGTTGLTALNADVVSAANADYNGGHNFATGTNGKGYDGGTFNSGAPGAHDIEADPRFVWQVLGLDPTDPTTPNVLGLAGWDADLGGPGTVAHALAELAQKNDPTGYDSRYSLPALLAWVWAMHRPTNPAYVATTYPGDPATTDAAGHAFAGTVGALAYLQPDSDYTLTGPASGVPGGVSAPFTVGLAFGVDPGGTVTITPAVSGFTGTFTPASVALSNTTREATFTLTPDPAATGSGLVFVTNSGTLADPGPAAYTLAYDPPPGLAAWTAALQWSATGAPNAYPPSGGVSLDATDHYDPIRVFQNVRDHTGDSGWNVQIAAAVTRYRDQFVRQAGGGANAVHAWNTGLTRHYHDTGDAHSREAGILLRRYAAGVGDETLTAFSFAWWGSRELAFGILDILGGEDLGYAPVARLHDLIANAMGHVDQWTWGHAGSPYTAIGPRPVYIAVQPFMVGITCEALIAYHDRYGAAHVAGIPAKVKQALDWLWGNAYISSGQAFPYYNSPIVADYITTTTGTVASVTSSTAFAGNPELSPYDGAYSGNYPGLVTFTSGAQAGKAAYLLFYTGYTGATRTFTLNPGIPPPDGNPLTGSPGIGDAFTVTYLKYDLGTVASAADTTHLTAAAGLDETPGHYAFAEIAFATGSQAGRTAKVAAYSGSTRAFELHDPGGYLSGPASAGSVFLLRSYTGPDGNDASNLQPKPALNLFLAPAYAWYYQWTARQGARDAAYRTRHDLLFGGSLPATTPGGDLGTQKQYNESYRWSPWGLKWRDYGDTAWPVATHLRLAAPAVASGRANAWSGPFRLHLSDAGDTGARVGLGSADRVTVVLSDGGAGGTFSPAGPILSTDRGWATFRYRAAAGIPNGTVIPITATATSLTAPAAVNYTIAGGSAPTATGYAFTGPATGPVGSASAPFTLALVPASSVPDAATDAIGGVLAVSPYDTAANPTGGADSTRFRLTDLAVAQALTVPLTGDNPAPQFVYTAPLAGTYTLQATASPALPGDPQSLTYTASAAPPPATGGRLRLRTAAGVLRLRVGS